MRILVTGASGFVGSLLTGSLLREGHEVRAFARDAGRIRGALEATPHAEESRSCSAAGPRGAPTVECATGDAVSGEGLAEALDQVEVAYYLIHSMERAPAGGSLAARERRAAENFAEAAVAAGVRRVVYLGGLVPRFRDAEQPLTRPASRHLASREDVERLLLAAVPDSLALRASIVIGARSRSFRLLVRLVERMPVMTLPSWQRFRTQPIDERDVIAMLTAAARPGAPRGSLDIGGPDVLSYGEMLRRIAELMLVGRPSLNVPLTLRGLSGRIAAAIAGEDPELVSALMEGLKGDLLPVAAGASSLLGVRLHSFDSAVEHALAEWEAIEPLAAR